MKRGTGFKPEAPIKEKRQSLGSKARFPTLKLHIPSLNPELKPQTLPNLNPKPPDKPPPSPLFASLSSTAVVHTPADAMGTAHIIAIVALQAFMVVTGPSFVAILVELSGTHLAAAAGVRN